MKQNGYAAAASGTLVGRGHHGCNLGGLRFGQTNASTPRKAEVQTTASGQCRSKQQEVSAPPANKLVCDSATASNGTPETYNTSVVSSDRSTTSAPTRLRIEVFMRAHSAQRRGERWRRTASARTGKQVPSAAIRSTEKLSRLRSANLM
jgi:hypothetical protein